MYIHMYRERYSALRYVALAKKTSALRDCLLNQCKVL